MVFLTHEGTEKEEDRVVVPAVDGINYSELFIFPMAPQRPCQSQSVLYTTSKLNKEVMKSGRGTYFGLEQFVSCCLTTTFLYVSMNTTNNKNHIRDWAAAKQAHVDELGGDSAVLATEHDNNAGNMNWVLDTWCWGRMLIIKMDR